MARSETDLGAYDAVGLTDLYQSGQASPLEATRAALDRIDRFNDAVNAYVHVDREGAEEQARASEQRWQQGQPLSPIDGVPASLKDLTHVRGMPCREGSLTSSDGPRGDDSPPARFLRDAGTVLLGKTNTPEFGWKAVTDNAVFGTTYNPWDTRLTPGGSSGGAAAAAALNMGVLHQGGDSGGSIRIPASFCGVFGIKPTFGWTPQWPPSKAAGLSSIGPITRTVDDSVRMLNIIGRYDFNDPYAVHGQPDDWGWEIGDDLSDLRIAYSPTLGYADVNPEIAERVREAAANLEALGAEIVEVDPGFESPLWIFERIWFTASQALCNALPADKYALLDPGLRENARNAEELTALDLFQATAAQSRLIRSLEQFNRDYHLIMTPSVAIEPFDPSDQVPQGRDMRDWEEWTPFSYPFNLTEQPAASIPCGFTTDGLPVGFQLAGGKFDDARILRVARAYMDTYPARYPSAPNLV